jgi:hypothetical protein
MLRVGGVVPGACGVAILWRLYGDEDGPLRTSPNLSLRLSRNDIVRHLIDQATLDSLEGIKRHVKKTTTHPQEQPNKYGIEEKFRTETRVHHFKKWLRSHD